jgi:hypothetical protein
LETKDKNLPRGGLTDIGQALAWNDTNRYTPDCLLLLTDGQVTKGSSLERLASRTKIPIYAVVAGVKLRNIDISLRALQVEQEVYLGEAVPISVNVRRNSEAVNGFLCRLQGDSGKVITQEKVEFLPGSFEVTLELTYTPEKIGEEILQLLIPPQPGEDSLVNNSRHFSLVVQKRGINILVISSYPRFDSRFLKRYFEEKRGVIIHLLHPFRGQMVDAESMKPADVTSLISEATVIILDNPAPKFVAQNLLTQITNHVKLGKSGLLVFGGEQLDIANTSLAEIFPLQESGGYLSESQNLLLTDQGAIHPITQLSHSLQLNQFVFSDFPTLSGISIFHKIRGGANVLLRSREQNLPILVASRAGSGRIVVFLADGLSRILFHPPLLTRSAQHFKKLLEQIVGWVSAGSGEKLELRLEKNMGVVGEEIHLFAGGEGKKKRTLTIFDSSNTEFFKRQYTDSEAYFSVAERIAYQQSGLYRINLTDGVTQVNRNLFIEEPTQEFESTDPARLELEKLCRETGGMVVKSEEIAELVKKIPPQHKVEVHQIFHSLADLPFAFFLVFLPLMLEWSLRKLWRLE